MAAEAARWVVTGGVGFIGSHVVDALRARGNEVVIIDDFSEGATPAADKERHLALLEAAHGPIRTLRACITDRAAIAPCFEGAAGVIHLAALAGVRPSVEEPARYARINVEGTATVMEAARAAGARRVVIASSSSVYGSSTTLPAREDAPAAEPESPYAASKRGSELIASSLAACHPQLSVALLRFYTVYGPRQRPEMAIAKFMRGTLRGEPITVFGDGTMRRDFTHVSDIARGVLAAADRAPMGARVYNLGASSPVTLRDLVRAIGEVAGRAPIVRHAPKQPGDADATHADISRAAAELGWTPEIELRDGLVTVREWLERG